ncbi:glycosyl transferase [Lactobacillus sp.] [Lactiplantibacillus mudanjiangensis]|uniref:Glycosyl transferase [Lactobacillus sp.] n=2 Tax=Lactiplantibacillus mudanjiangensis TaxID=1296538 RepID=A0A660E3Y2_9LACO|nr:glycosyl transferase [Lactobacillus sp.] [Lactiplantibacillus mudanjiangensis]VDG30504.1 glycosyl transferase [Lactobacillus sp.] [Lactiplantibacillus mudanjiangensis]VDG30721.1 glycosyl transferase [Lactobacillus sp.] [Lactiplantibacillus mudanjiangensis]
MKKIVYMWLVTIMSWLAHFKTTNQVIYLMSFADNLAFIRELQTQVGSRLTVYYLPSATTAADELAETGIAVRPFRDSLGFALTGIPVLTQADIIYCDNYYAFLGGLTRRSAQRIVQLWHADGAVKAFGWGDPQTSQRSRADQRRFQRVYNQFTDYVVGSPKMGQVFAASYHVDVDRMRVLGYPRSDRYRDAQWLDQTRTAIYQAHPEWRDRRIVLYAPTYREGVTFELPADFGQLQLAPDQVLVLKLHPHLQAQTAALIAQYPNLLTTATDFSTDDLLTVTDTLISDYSSVIFDYALLPNCQKMVFYVFDWQNYQQRVGLQLDFEQWAPGPLVRTVTALNQALAQPATPQQLPAFNALWNTHNDGQAGQRTVRYFHQQTKPYQK